MADKRLKIALEAAASLALAVVAYWSLGRLLRAFENLLSPASDTGHALGTLLIFLSPDYLGPLLVVALASSLFALLSYNRRDQQEEDTTGARARRRGIRPGGRITERSAPAARLMETDRGRREERAAGTRMDTAQEADPAAHPVCPRP